MRTTLTIDDDLAGILKRKAREMDKPFKELVNKALRKGLAEDMAEPTQRITIRPHDFGRLNPSLASSDFNQLLDEIDLDDYLKKENQ